MLTIAAIACQPPAQQSKGGQQAKQHIFLHELTVVLLCIAYRISATVVKSTLYARLSACWKDYIVFLMLQEHGLVNIELSAMKKVVERKYI